MQLWQVIALAGVILADVTALFAQSTPLRYFEPAEYRALSQSSSLPFRFGERVIRAPEEGEPRPLPGLLAFVPAPYQDVRDRMRSHIRGQLGESQYSEELHNDLVEYKEDAGEDKDGFYKAREEKSRLLLESDSIHVSPYHESKIVTSPYNAAWWRPSSSQTVLRIIDGRDLFGTVSTLVVIMRTDKELRVGFLHGLSIPVPAVGIRDGSLVTDKEVGWVDHVTKELKVDWHWYPFWESSLLANTNALIAIRREHNNLRK
ncbi:MAG TPA: hypothetical protein PKD12_22835 [Nitrospira sp.]|nr:hypothetical protein [Nitrospira sp.]